MTRMIPYDPLIPLGALRSCKHGAIHWCQVLNGGQNHMLWWFFQTSLAQHSHGRILTPSTHGRGSDLQLHGGSSGDGLFDPEGHWRLLIISYMLFCVENDLMRVWLLKIQTGIPVRASHRREESCFKTPLIVLCKDIGIHWILRKTLDRRPIFLRTKRCCELRSASRRCCWSQSSSRWSTIALPDVSWPGPSDFKCSSSSSAICAASLSHLRFHCLYFSMMNWEAAPSLCPFSVRTSVAKARQWWNYLWTKMRRCFLRRRR